MTTLGAQVAYTPIESITSELKSRLAICKNAFTDDNGKGWRGGPERGHLFR